MHLCVVLGPGLPEEMVALAPKFFEGCRDFRFSVQAEAALTGDDPPFFVPLSTSLGCLVRDSKL